MSSTLNLTPYKSVQQATFVRLVFSDGGTPVVVRMSTHDVPFSITENDGSTYSYPAVGALLNITAMTNEMKASQADVTITLSGIPTQYMESILDNPIKGAPVEIRRVFFNSANGQVLNIPGNPVMEFMGIVNNYSVDEGWGDSATQSVTTTISLSCSSIISVLLNKVAGRRTNQADQEYWFTGDLSMNRVAVISDAVFDFGGTTPSAPITTPTGKTVTGTV